MKANQFYPLYWDNNISRIKAKTNKKNAYMVIQIPDDLAEKLMKQIALNKNTPLHRLQLSWLDDTVTDDN